MDTLEIKKLQIAVNSLLETCEILRKEKSRLNVEYQNLRKEKQELIQKNQSAKQKLNELLERIKAMEVIP